MIIEIENSLRKDEFEKVFELTTQLLEKYPDNLLAFTYKGSSLYRLKRYPEAIEIFHEISTKRIPDKPLGFLYLARCYKAQKMYYEASKYLEKSLEKDPKHLTSLKELSHCFMMMKDHKNAIKILFFGAEFYPKDVYFWHWLSYSYHEINDLTNALICSIKATKISYVTTKALREIIIDSYYKNYEEAMKKQKLIAKVYFKNVLGDCLVRNSLELEESEIDSIENIIFFDVVKQDLKELKLRNNKISEISGLNDSPDLVLLDLSDNNIIKINGLSNQINLKELHLANNQIKKIEGLDNLKQLKTLDLSGNQVSNLGGLASLSELEHLNLSNNKITSLKDLEKIEALKHLDLSNNKLSTLDNLEKLPRLEILNLKRNPNLPKFFDDYYKNSEEIAKIRKYSGLSFVKLLEASKQEIQDRTKEREEQRVQRATEIRKSIERDGFEGSEVTSNYGSIHKLRERLDALLKLNESGSCLYCCASLPSNVNFADKCALALNQVIVETDTSLPMKAKDRDNYTDKTTGSMEFTRISSDAYARIGPTLRTKREYKSKSGSHFWKEYFPKLQGIVCQECSDKFVKRATTILKRLQRRRFKEKHFADHIQKAMKKCHEEYMKLYESMIAKRGF